MKYPKTIITGMLHRATVAMLRDDHMPASTIAAGYDVSARRCSRKHNDGHVELTGGLILTLKRPRAYQHTSLRPVCEVRLRRGWTEKSIEVALRRLWWKHRFAKILLDRREALYAAIEPQLTQTQKDVLSEMGEDAGHTSIYDEMSDGDLDYYFARIPSIRKEVDLAG